MAHCATVPFFIGFIRSLSSTVSRSSRSRAAAFRATCFLRPVPCTEISLPSHCQVTAWANSLPAWPARGSSTTCGFSWCFTMM